MEVEILQENLLKATTMAARFVSAKPKLPILSNLLLNAKDNQFEILATNLESSIKILVGAKVVQEGVTAVSAQTLLEYLSSIGPQKITVGLSGRGLKIKGDQSLASLVVIKPEEFPRFPSIKKETTFKIQGGLLKQLIQKTVFAAASDEGRPVLTGVLVRVHKKKIVFAATDGFRLSEVFAPLKDFTAETDLTFVIPARSLRELERLLDGKNEEMVEVLQVEDNGQLCFRFEGYTVITRLLEAQYPEYKKIIPNEFSLQAQVEIEVLLQAVKTAAIFTDSDSQIVKLEFNSSKNEIIVAGESAALGNSQTKTLGDLKGESQTMAFNARFLKDGLASLKGDQVLIKIKGPVAPVVISSVGETNYQHIIMPVRLNQKE